MRKFLKSQGLGKFYENDKVTNEIFDRLNKYDHAKVTFATFAEVMTPIAADLAAANDIRSNPVVYPMSEDNRLLAREAQKEQVNVAPLRILDRQAIQLNKGASSASSLHFPKGMSPSHYELTSGESQRRHSNPIDENIYQFDRELASVTITPKGSGGRSVPNQDLDNVDVKPPEGEYEPAEDEYPEEMIQKCMA